MKHECVDLNFVKCRGRLYVIVYVHLREISKNLKNDTFLYTFVCGAHAAEYICELIYIYIYQKLYICIYVKIKLKQKGTNEINRNKHMQSMIR